jgi:hypothetical protein
MCCPILVKKMSGKMKSDIASPDLIKSSGQENVEFYYGHFFTVTFTRTKKESSPIQERPLDLLIYKTIYL